MSGQYQKLVCTLLLLLVAGPLSAELLRRDPFKPPAELLAAPVSNGSAPLAVGTQPKIRGILVAGDQSLVNLGGELLGIGESANGYRLLQVSEDHAVFQRGDEVITLSLYPDKEDAG